MDRSFNYIISPEISEFRRFSPKLKIGVLASGKGTNFQELIDLSEKGELDIDIKVLITNKDDAGCIQRAESKKINYKIYPKSLNFHSFYIFVSFIYYSIISIRIVQRFKSFKFV